MQVQIELQANLAGLGPRGTILTVEETDYIKGLTRNNKVRVLGRGETPEPKVEAPKPVSESSPRRQQRLERQRAENETTLFATARRRRAQAEREASESDDSPESPDEPSVPQEPPQSANDSE